ncbi:organic cation transporter protein-like [Penaeus japonicus]|uniref:organic cation transporter protein-like n=1 Tax=Penaeus japonicus TaxID=27405 RepID=UPI001C70BF23|nr:organic cation transporter protein-like [Penaeus japonicus]
MSKFDDLLEQLGTGKWNLVIVISVGYWVFQIPCHSMGAAFLTPDLNHSCRLPPEALVDIQASNETRSQCTYNITSVDKNEEHLCTHWDFDNTTYTNTITSEFELVCEYSFLRPLFKSIYFLGAFLGSLVNGWLTDRYGRKRMLFLATVVFAIFGNILCWLPNIHAILVVRFFMGVMHPTSIFAGYSLSMETCEPRHRSIVGILIFLPWSLCIIALGGYGYALRDWRWFAFAVSLPMLLFLPALWFIDESPRWLIVRGRHEDALRVLQRASRWNRTKLLPKKELLAFMEDIEAEARGERVNGRPEAQGLLGFLRRVVKEVTALVSTRKMRDITLSLYANYLVLGMVYFGLSLGGDKFGVDPFVYMALSGIMEIPGSTLTIPLVEKLGRRPSSVASFFVTAGALLVLGVTPSGIDWLVTTMAMVGKLAISAAFQIVFLHATELFPTEVRVRGLGTCIMMVHIGSMTAPFLVEGLGSIGSWLPLVVFGGASLLAGIVNLRLPETRGEPLQDTVAGLEASSNVRQRRVSSIAKQDGTQESVPLQ